ncbi:hypothetical protein [Rhodocyclus tenuis]|uniref:DUF3325 family protein n=1 Tax=Rhodocyclus tenuis TaxID=1066 RepID=A0A840G6J5_RHOTE|nr:hypothetical protein [Rhodocyclus tenuis]MBB4247993.1 hypothetical protein [Rhodocyclus tenuis]
MGAGLALLLGGCLLIYLASPNQRWRARPLAGMPGRTAGALLLALALYQLQHGMQGVAAVFTWSLGVMLALTLLPFLSALFHVYRGR